MNGLVVESHLPDPGRLKELLTPGAELYISSVPKNTHRKTQYTTRMVRYNGTLVSLVSTLPNQFVKEALESGELSMFTDYKMIRPEYTVGRHRFDFLLEDSDKHEFYLEVKSVTYAENGIAEFPDAVTSRGSKHIKTLVDAIKKGYKSYVLFLVQIQNIENFQIAKDIDKIYYENYLLAKKDGVQFLAYRCNIDTNSITIEKKLNIINE